MDSALGGASCSRLHTMYPEQEIFPHLMREGKEAQTDDHTDQGVDTHTHFQETARGKILWSIASFKKGRSYMFYVSDM